MEDLVPLALCLVQVTREAKGPIITREGFMVETMEEAASIVD